MQSTPRKNSSPLGIDNRHRDWKSPAPPSVNGRSEATDLPDATAMTTANTEAALGRSTIGGVGIPIPTEAAVAATTACSRDRERKRQQFEEDQAKRTLSKSPKRQLDQGDDSKRREQSRSRSREPRPPSSEDKEKEPRERSQSPTEQMQFATNNFEMLLTKQKQALEQMNQERDAKHRRK